MLNEKNALIALNHVKGLGPIRIRRLIEEKGSALEALKGFILDDAWKKEIEVCAEVCERLGIEVVAFNEPSYPALLKNCPDAPILLYIKGKLPSQEKIGIVGTRNASFYGLENAEKIAKDLARNGWCVVSGLARGVDTKAHVGAIECTIAVLGSGLLHIYPKENEALAEKICEKGAVISEYPLFMPPSKENFPRRNRIISGLCNHVILIEAPMKSGAMITMQYAFSQKRKCYAFPGRVDMENYRGNHALIKEGRATLIEGVSDLGVEIKELGEVDCLDKFLNTEEKILYLTLKEESSIEELLEKTKLPITKLNFLLMSLMLKNRIKEYPGKRYKVRLLNG